MEPDPKNPTTPSAEELVSSLEKALKLNKYGALFFKSSKLDGALKSFQKAQEILAKVSIPFTNAIVNQANVYAQRKDYQNALKKYEEAIRLSPHNPENKAIKNSENVSREILLNKNVNSLGAYVDSHTNAGFTLLGLKMPQKAYEFCLKSMELEPENLQNFINFSNALRMTGRRGKAIELTWANIVKKYAENHKNKVFSPKTIDIEKCENLTPENEEELNSEPINIITMKWGKKYGPEYVNKLFRGFKKNTNRPFRFILFTDDEEGLLPEIETKPMANEWRALLAKSTIFSKEHGFKGLNMWIDLDMIITSDIDEIFKFKGKFALMRTDEIANETLNKGGYNSSILLWRGDEYSMIYDLLQECWAELNCFCYRFDYWLEMVVENAEFVQDMFPGKIKDYLAECKDSLPEEAAIVAFPRDPKPHEVTDGWIPEYWV